MPGSVLDSAPVLACPPRVDPGHFAVGLYDHRDVMALLGVSPRTLWNWRHRPANPLEFHPTAPGSRTFFISREELLAWLRRNADTSAARKLRKARTEGMRRAAKNRAAN